MEKFVRWVYRSLVSPRGLLSVKTVIAAPPVLAPLAASLPVGFIKPPPYALAIRSRISSTRHAVTRGPSFTGLGKYPDLTPSHQQVFCTGMMGGIGGSALGSPIICFRRRKPVSGNCCMLIAPFRMRPLPADRASKHQAIRANRLARFSLFPQATESVFQPRNRRRVPTVTILAVEDAIFGDIVDHGSAIMLAKLRQ